MLLPALYVASFSLELEAGIQVTSILLVQVCPLLIHPHPSHHSSDSPPKTMALTVQAHLSL